MQGLRCSALGGLFCLLTLLLSRDGQASFQKIMNSADLLVESLRIDIPKDVVPAGQRRAAGTKYIMMDMPERSNQELVNKLFKEIIKSK